MGSGAASPLETNPFLSEFHAKYGLPAEAARGGAETMYPEYQLKIRKKRGRGAAGCSPMTSLDYWPACRR